MATKGIKGICYSESSQLNDLNSVHFQHSHIRKFCDGTRHFTRLSSKVFDNVIYESIYGASIPGMSDDIMGGNKRYSSIISDSGNDIKRRSVESVEVTSYKANDVKMVEMQTENDVILNESSEVEVTQNNLKTLDSNVDHSVAPTALRPCGNIEKPVVAKQVEEIVVKQDTPKPEVGSLETDFSNGSISRANSQSAEEISPHVRSKSDSIGRTPRNSNQVDITSDPLYKEIYANNLRQYGFLLAKKLGISNQSPRELRATYLQNRQKAELRRERSNSSFSDFSKRLSKPASPTSNGRRQSMDEVPVTKRDVGDVETAVKVLPPRMQRANTIGCVESTVKEFPVRNRMQRSNTIELIDHKDKIVGSLHSRSISDVTNKYSDSLTNINEILDERDPNKAHARRLKKFSCMETRRNSNSPPLVNTPRLSNSSDSINKNEEVSEENVTEPCHQRLNSGSFSDKEPSKKQPTSVLRRKHKNIRDPHKRLSVPLFNTNNGSNSPPRHTRKLSLPVYTQALTSMASLSVPDLYHNSSFGKEQLMDAYCKQEVPRKKLSVESLRRHNEAKERLEWRMSKLRTFEGILSEADSLMKDIRTMNASNTNTTIAEETTTAPAE